MKVIKHGIAPKYRITCPRCNAILEFTRNDVETIYPSQAAIEMYGDEAMPVNYVVCPDCIKHIDRIMLPDDWTKKLKYEDNN